MFGIRLPRALTAAVIDQALKASEGIAGLSAAMRGLIAARTAVMTTVAAIDADMRRMAKSLGGLQPADEQSSRRGRIRPRSRSWPQSTIRRPSPDREMSALDLGLVPRRYVSGKVDYVGSISKCQDRRVRTLLYEAANVMLTRYKGQLKLRDWPSPSPSDQRCARPGSLWLVAWRFIITHVMLRDGTEFRADLGLAIQEIGGRIELPRGATS